jgi:hypothetical protein
MDWQVPKKLESLIERVLIYVFLPEPAHFKRKIKEKSSDN